MSKLLSKSIDLTRNLTFGSKKVRVAAFIYDGRRLLSIGQNNMATMDAKAAYFGRRFNVEKFIQFPFKHAEIDAISKLWGRYYITGKETLVVVRLNKSNQPCLAKPCSNCQIVLDALGFRKIEWTDNVSV